MNESKGSKKTKQSIIIYPLIFHQQAEFSHFLRTGDWACVTVLWRTKISITNVPSRPSSFLSASIDKHYIIWYGISQEKHCFLPLLPANADSSMKVALVIIDSIPVTLNTECLEIWWLFIVYRENESESNTLGCQLMYQSLLQVHSSCRQIQSCFMSIYWVLIPYNFITSFISSCYSSSLSIHFMFPFLNTVKQYKLITVTLKLISSSATLPVISIIHYHKCWCRLPVCWQLPSCFHLSTNSFFLLLPIILP